MKKLSYWSICIGGLLMGIPLFIKSFYNLSDTIGDFIKGLGVGIILASFFLGVWHARKLKRKGLAN